MKAVLLCAGIGTRLRPFTYLKPKPLIHIGGKALLERTVAMLQASGIHDITVVAGYKAEEILPYLQKLNVRWVISESFNTHNNHSSLKLVKDQLDDCLIIDGDLYLQKNITPFVVPGRSQFIAQETTSGLEWQLFTDDTDRIVEVRKDSPRGYAMSGVSYWVGEAAAALADELDRCAPEEFWEDAAMRVLPDYPVYLTRSPMFQVEIDSLYEAAEKNLATPDELAEQCSLAPLEKLKGLTNATYLVDYGAGKRVLRIPGLGTSKFINRADEVALVGLLEETGVTPDTVFYADGIKTSAFLEGYTVFSELPLSDSMLSLLTGRLKQMHAIKWKKDSGCTCFSLLAEIDNYERKAGVSFVTDKERLLLKRIAHQLDADAPVLCHRDLLLDNILFSQEKDDVKIIDFEYAAFSSAYWDVANFITEAKLEGDNRLYFIESYGELDPLRVLEAEVLVDYIWGLWGWLNNCIDYGRKRMVAFHNNLSRLQSLIET